MEERSPRSLRLSRVFPATKANRTLPVPAGLINSLLKGGAAAAFGLALEELWRKLPKVQAFLWVRDASNHFRLQAVAGVPRAALEGFEEVQEASLKSACLGSPEDWLGGAVHLDTQQHILYRVFGERPGGAALALQEPPANLTLPLVADQQVWAVLHLHAQAQHLGQAEAKWVGQFFSGVAPILREVYLREQAQRESLWLSVINDLLRTSREQPLELALQEALEQATRLAGAEGARLIAFEGQAIRTIAQAGWGAGLPVEAAITRQLSEQLHKGQQVNIPRYHLYPSQHPELVEAGLCSLFMLPIRRRGSETSALLLFSAQPWLPDALTQTLLGDLAEAIGLVQVEWALRRELAWAAYTDPLTGLGNRRAFERDLEKLTARPSGRVVVLIVLDLDDFKAINDTYGHLHADHLLVRLGGVLRSRARAGDRAFRLGGDEFALIIEGSSSLSPQRIAERYRAMLEEIRVSDRTYLRVSLGYAVYPTEVGDPQSLWRLADDQMYKDKARRKGRIPLLAAGLEPTRWMLQIETPLFRLVSRLAQVLNMQPEERQVLQAGCYLLELAMGRVAPALEVQIPEGLLREAARILMYLHSPWDGVQRSQGLSNERIPRAAHVLQVAQYFIAAIEAVEGRSARSIEEALREIAAQTQQRFDPMVVEALFALRDWLSNELTA
ncbi:GGDEF domain-containing protein [Meiothermus cerbereus]|uniref:GGDEF domain-containing protein n=1 Tax=Meiothermus cerbereus TaxID=65552 RepID=UPI000A04B444|nr:GGDEF domain-containing protein [Meiothermus cerbereus]